jgi:hypothetical protein
LWYSNVAGRIEVKKRTTEEPAILTVPIVSATVPTSPLIMATPVPGISVSTTPVPTETANVTIPVATTTINVPSVTMRTDTTAVTTSLSTDVTSNHDNSGTILSGEIADMELGKEIVVEMVAVSDQADIVDMGLASLGVDQPGADAVHTVTVGGQEQGGETLHTITVTRQMEQQLCSETGLILEVSNQPDTVAEVGSGPTGVSGNSVECGGQTEIVESGGGDGEMGVAPLVIAALSELDGDEEVSAPVLLSLQTQSCESSTVGEPVSRASLSGDRSVGHVLTIPGANRVILPIFHPAPASPQAQDDDDDVPRSGMSTASTQTPIAKRLPNLAHSYKTISVHTPGTPSSSSSSSTQGPTGGVQKTVTVHIQKNPDYKEAGEGGEDADHRQEFIVVHLPEGATVKQAVVRDHTHLEVSTSRAPRSNRPSSGNKLT